MSGPQLKEARQAALCTQQQAAHKLGITQAYLSMVERGKRPVSNDLALRVVKLFDIAATALPFHESPAASCKNNVFFASALGSLGYSGFAHLRGKVRVNPAELLWHALECDNLDPRVTEALPWLSLAYPALDWQWLARNARLRDRQNRLAFVVALASEAAVKKGNRNLAAALAEKVRNLEPSRLASEGTLCRESMTLAERKWLRTHRSPLAAHWNLLTDLALEHLDYVFH